VTVDARVDGPLTAPVITADATTDRTPAFAGKPVRDLQLSARADSNPEALSADLELTATVDGNDLAVALRAEPEGDGLRVPTVSLTAGENTLSGDLAIADLARATQTLTGSLTIAAPDLSEFSALALTELSGRLSGQVDLTQEAGRATAHVQLTGTEISAAGTQVAGLDADLTLRDLFHRPGPCRQGACDRNPRRRHAGRAGRHHRKRHRRQHEVFAGRPPREGRQRRWRGARRNARDRQ
jgi:translocation and assembly module TamB